MKIAVLFTGQIRPNDNDNIGENIQFLFSNLKGVDVDYFCTTWYQSNMNYSMIESMLNFKIFDIETYNQYTTQFVKDYNKFAEHCENYKTDNKEYILRSDHDRVNGVWKNIPIIFYKLQRGIKLIEQYQLLNNIKYDMIFRLRWDTTFHKQFTSDHINKVIENNLLGVYVHSFVDYVKYYEKASWLPENNHDNFLYHKYIDGWVDETIYYGNFVTMQKLSNIYDEYYNVCKYTNCWIVHIILKEYIKLHNIKTIVPEVTISLKNSMIYHYYH